MEGKETDRRIDELYQCLLMNSMNYKIDVNMTCQNSPIDFKLGMLMMPNTVRYNVESAATR